MQKKKIKELKSLSKLGEDIGLLFQLADDFIDFNGSKKLAGKSTKKDLKKGSVIKKDYLTMKKPGFGFKENQMKNIVGRKVANFVSSKRILKPKDIS